MHNSTDLSSKNPSFYHTQTMKSIELFCASPASTAICSSMDQNSMVRRAIRRQIHRDTTHHHRLGSGGRTHHHAPYSSQIPPFDPEPYYQKGRKSDAKNKQNQQLRPKSSADVVAGRSSPHGGSSRYLLRTDNPRFEVDVVSAALIPYEPANDKQLKATELPLFRSSSVRSNESPIYIPSPHSHSQVRKSSSSHAQVHKSSSTLSHYGDQIVELRVSIHCKGCEGKVRKHLSKMEGVTSFSTDLASKKVTVIGNVTPLGVLASISKVKTVQFWPSPSQSSASSSTSTSSSSSAMSRRA